MRYSLCVCDFTARHVAHIKIEMVSELNLQNKFMQIK